jgi:glucose/mannose transport system substrate-binding protein
MAILALVCFDTHEKRNAVHLSDTSDAIAEAHPSIVVMHWLSTGAEAAALAVVRDRFTSEGGQWRESAMPGVAAANATSLNRILGGNAPTVFQVSVGTRLQELGRLGLISPIGLPTGEWDLMLPPIIARAAKQGGRYIATPIGISGENWMFYNKAVLADAGLGVPTSWKEFLVVAEALSAAGKTPIALGGQPWQERILFNSVLLGVGGRSFYRHIYQQLDHDAFASDALLETFRIFGALRKFVDRASPGRPWDTATMMLVKGDAAFQFIGDWAKGPIRAAGLEPGNQIGCSLAPGPDVAYIMAVDAFAMSNSTSPEAIAGQRLFVRTAIDPHVQAAFNRIRGSIPARLDAPDTGFDTCAKYAMRIIKDPNAQLVSTGLFGLTGGMSGAIDDAISQFWNDPDLDAKHGKALFVQSIDAFR